MADSKLKIDIRRSQILELLRQTGKVQVSDLSRELGATTVTIRSDLDALERDGYLIRIQGGALLKLRPQSDWGVGNEAAALMAEKQAIARAVAGRIPNGATLFLNSGTTTHCLAAALKDHKRLNVVTNSLAVAMELGSLSAIHVLLLGGEINAQCGFTYGADAQEQLGRYQADWAVLSVDGVSAQGGVTSFHAEETPVNRLMIERSKQLVIAADYTKIGRTGFTHICSAGPNVQLVTDSKCRAAAVEELEALGAAVTIVSASGTAAVQH